MHGWIIIDKPQGLTSSQVVGRVKRFTGAKKVGHAGTLDPMATGILPIGLGEATKVMPYIESAGKSYRFTVQFGSATDTDDAEGTTIATSEKIPTLAEITSALPSFTGKIEQVPPRYSAIKINGERAYDLAREGAAFEIKSRTVVVEKLEIVEESLKSVGKITLEMACSKGTYVRAIARDLALKLGTYAHVSMLRRTAVGKFSEAQAISLDSLQGFVHNAPLSEGGKPSWLLPVEAVLDDILVLPLSHTEAAALKQGKSIISPPSRSGLFQAHHEGTLVAMVEATGGMTKPVRVFNL